MTNAVTGLVTFEVRGKPHGLKLGMNAICSIEEDLGKSLNQLQAELNNPNSFKMSDLRIVVFHCLKDGGSKVDTLEDAGRVVDQVGFEETGKLLAKATALAFPKSDDKDDGEGKPKAAQ